MSTFEFGQSATWGNRPVARHVSDCLLRTRLITTGTIQRTETINIGGSPTYRCTLNDGSGEVDLLFVGRRFVGGLQPDTRCTVEGTIGKRGDRLVLWNPLYKIESK